MATNGCIKSFQPNNNTRHAYLQCVRGAQQQCSRFRISESEVEVGCRRTPTTPVVCRSASVGASLSCTRHGTDAELARILAAASGRNHAASRVDRAARRTPCNRLPAGTFPGNSEMGSCRRDSHGRTAARNAPFNTIRLLFKQSFTVLTCNFNSV